MNKDTYETYEFLPASGGESETDQFFVVQDDGTFLLNRQIQYVAQVQDVKEVLEDVQPCTVYGVGVSSQQFFVDVENSTELISADQFIIPDGDSSIYANSFLLQPGSSTSTEQQMEEDVVVDQFQETNTQEMDIELSSHNSKQANNLTEITLSDEQYRVMEQKGWLLLELQDKIFVLNTLGLHDITSNDKLIQKLKNELQNDTYTKIDSDPIKIENIANQYPNLVAQPFASQPDTVEFVIGSNEEQENSMNNLQFVVSEPEKVTEPVVNKERQIPITKSNQESLLKHDINEMATIKKESLEGMSSIKIKTKFSFKDVPDKIVLGKTVNGKRLVAKVVKTPINTNKENINKPPASDEIATTENPPENPSNEGLSEAELVSLIQQSVRRGPDDKLDAEEVASAESVLSQLLKVPNLSKSLIGHNLIITRTKNNKDILGVIYNKSSVALVTGLVVVKEDSTFSFEYVPDLLQNIKANLEDTSVEDVHIDSIDYDKDICLVFHIHICETKCADNVVRVSVTMNKRKLSINQMFDMKKRHPNRVFGCSACAALFKSEAALQEHQDNKCRDTNGILTVDANKIDMVDAYAMVKTNSIDKSYSCKQCDTKFTKLYTCIRHVKTHLGLHRPKPDINKDNSGKEAENEQAEPTATKPVKEKEIYKCKMCRSTYFHPATLSKHIVSRHIKMK